jgi:hypothetical protein
VGPYLVELAYFSTYLQHLLQVVVTQLGQLTVVLWLERLVVLRQIHNHLPLAQAQLVLPLVLPLLQLVVQMVWHKHHHCHPLLLQLLQVQLLLLVEVEYQLLLLEHQYNCLKHLQMLALELCLLPLLVQPCRRRRRQLLLFQHQFVLLH